MVTCWKWYKYILILFRISKQSFNVPPNVKHTIKANYSYIWRIIWHNLHLAKFRKKIKIIWKKMTNYWRKSWNTENWDFNYTIFQGDKRSHPMWDTSVQGRSLKSVAANRKRKNVLIKIQKIWRKLLKQKNNLCIIEKWYLHFTIS